MLSPFCTPDLWHGIAMTTQGRDHAMFNNNGQNIFFKLVNTVRSTYNGRLQYSGQMSTIWVTSMIFEVVTLPVYVSLLAMIIVKRRPPELKFRSSFFHVFSIDGSGPICSFSYSFSFTDRLPHVLPLRFYRENYEYKVGLAISDAIDIVWYFYKVCFTRGAVVRTIFSLMEPAGFNIPLRNLHSFSHKT